MDRRFGQTHGSTRINGSEDLLSKWGPALASWPVPLAAYLGVAALFPGVLSSAAGFLTGLAIATLAASLALGLVSRALGLYVRDPHGEPRTDPQRQGIFAAETALLISYFVFPRFGVVQPLWLYIVAFFLAGAVGMAAIGAVAGGKARLRMRDTTLPPAPPPRRTGPDDAKVAPKWAQQVAAACLIFGVVSLVRLVLGGEQYFLWGGLALLAVGALLPSLVVAAGGGVKPDKM